MTRDVPPYSVVVGSPARVVKQRFSTPLIERLLASRWWELDPKLLLEISTRDISESLDRLAASDIPTFATNYRQLTPPGATT